MNPEEISAYVALAVAVVSVVYQFVSISVRFAKLELKVDTMWSFLVRRGQAEAVRTGIATLNSPIIVTEEAKEWMRHMGPELRAIKASLVPDISDDRLAFVIESKLGDRILKEVCIPQNLMFGACLIIAVAVAKEGSPQDNASKKGTT